MVRGRRRRAGERGVKDIRTEPGPSDSNHCTGDSSVPGSFARAAAQYAFTYTGRACLFCISSFDGRPGGA